MRRRNACADSAYCRAGRKAARGTIHAVGPIGGGQNMITITSLWILAIALLVCILARSMRTVHRALRCPIRGTDVRVSYLEAVPEGRPIEVTACSEFRPNAAITCDRRCLALLARRPGRALNS
jgi:hypothetical protein